MNAHLNFCTLFDKGFLIKGLALHHSLSTHIGKFTLWILCMDDLTYQTLEKLRLQNVQLITLKEFEDDELKEIKKTRSQRKYFFTISPSLPLYILTYKNVEHITYLDADLYFFSSPEIIYKEMGAHSIMIIPHNLVATRKAKEKEVGTYNVGMLIFRNDTYALECLHWWRMQCNLYCDDTERPGHYDDQGYLDYFEEKFKGVYILKNRGANVAPWNIQGMPIYTKEKEVYVGPDKLVFFHFSGFGLYPRSMILPYGPQTFREYTRSSPAKDLMYKPYAQCLYQMLESVRTVEPDWQYGVIVRPGFKQNSEQFFNNSIYYPGRRLVKTILSPLLKKIKTKQLL
ncbi:MAG: hypothetical protein A3C06_02900 [Candidatus Taylorbacteria bacterium RIFCSPHIGHO2_02_FULL_46_13]|uniref:Glycosyl transferase n=1 Tax=Candidatus Taylorbacteria bacterium RIFCSPHIGHO2_02_FULL_46_13 TaxID=1802312 RepID=A0A1G2MRI0_9BACT|nr:MAG: hypothetical protein A3C06_02900 [Candidatus Taylorbacteria bacterium RIFCSPHIGHO2_02_FULL_46_13]